MSDFMMMLKGKKTYILGFMALASLACEMTGVMKMPEGWYEMLGFGSFVAIRHGMQSKEE